MRLATLAPRQGAQRGADARGEGDLFQSDLLLLSLSKGDRGQGLMTFSTVR